MLVAFGALRSASVDVGLVLAPAVVVAAATLFYLSVQIRREGHLPIFEAGTFVVLATAIESIVPLLQFVLGGMGAGPRVATDAFVASVVCRDGVRPRRSSPARANAGAAREGWRHGVMMIGARVVSRIRELSFSRIQLLAAESVFVAFFLSVARYKIWYIATLAALVITLLIGAFGAVTLRGLLRDIAPLIVYFVYLYIAAGWSEYAAEARWWVAADAIGVPVFALFWVAARNSRPDYVRWSFVRVTLIAGTLVAPSFLQNPGAARMGGYTLAYLPVAVPFLWTELLERRRHLWPGLALMFALTILFLSRTRTPLVTGIAMLVGSLVFIGRGLRQKIRSAILIAFFGLIVGALLLAFSPTRYALLAFFARIAHRDVLIGDIYIPGEPQDAVRGNLHAIVKEKLLDAQPFGVGYMTTQKLYERAYHGDSYSLHDIYQTWLFEGGVLCVLIVLVMFVRHFRALRFVRCRAVSADEAGLALCILLATVAQLLFGLFQQAHHGPVLYSLLGLGLGLRARVLAERRQAAGVSA